MADHSISAVEQDDIDDVAIRTAGLWPRMFMFDGYSMIWTLLFIFNPGKTSFYLALFFMMASSFLERNLRISVPIAFGLAKLFIVTAGLRNRQVTTIDMMGKRWL